MSQEIFQFMAETPVEAQEIPEYEGPYDGEIPLELETEADMPSEPSHSYSLRPTKKRSCSPAKKAAPPPRTIPR